MKNSIANILARTQLVVAVTLAMIALSPAGHAAAEEKNKSSADTSSEVRQLREQLTEQTKRIDRLYDALGPELQEMEQRAAELKKQQEEDTQLKLEMVCTLVGQGLTSKAQISSLGVGSYN
jgi:small-conductance mechanosensitive channel